jgi:hypothetical protein
MAQFDRHDANSLAGVTEVSVANGTRDVINHPMYDPKDQYSNKYDVALMFLDHDVPNASKYW